MWKDNKFHGFGTLYNQDADVESRLTTNFDNFNLNENSSWTHFEGEFVEDRKCGYGVVWFSNGDKFSGSFKHDAANGYGTIYCANRRKINGIWKGNILIT